MATLLNHPQAYNFSYRFRAFCRDDNYLGRWRTAEDAAIADADRHKRQPGNEDHIIEIEIEQRYTVAWDNG